MSYPVFTQDEEIRALQIELHAALRENDSMSQTSMTKEQESAMVVGTFGIIQKLIKFCNFVIYHCDFIVYHLAWY